MRQPVILKRDAVAKFLTKTGIQNRDCPVGAEAVSVVVRGVMRERANGESVPVEILRIVQGGGNVGELYELIDPGFVPDNIKIRTKLAGKERMINLADPRRGLRADYDVTDQVKLRGGHPTFTSINKASTDLLKAMWKQLRGKGD